MRKLHRPRISPFVAGLVGIIAILLFSYGAYTKFSNPFASPYTVHAVFANANGLRPDSLVRIAGVNVGKVSSVAPVSGCRLKVSSGPQQQCSAADVTMTISDNGLPIHKDATFAIRPRIFLEGNFFVDVHPGTPEAPVAPSGFVFPIQQGTDPVQFDQLLTSLQNNTRSNLQILVQEYGQAVKLGGPAYNASIQYWTPAYKYGGEVAHDTLGTQPHDLSGWIDKGGVVNGAFSKHPLNLENLVTDFNTTALAFARQNQALSSAVAELPRTLGVAIPALNALEGALCTGTAVPNCAPGPLRLFAQRLVPGVKSTGPMVDASLPLFHQLRLLVQPSELGGLTNDLSATIPALAKLNYESIPFMKNEVRPAASCQVKVILPWTNLTIQDPNFNASNGFPPHPAYVEGVDFLPGLAGESRDFDANGPYVRVLGTGGTLTYSLSPGMFGTALSPIMGTQPELPALHNSGDGAPVPVSRPPLKPSVPCETQAPITDLSAPTGAAPRPVSAPVSAPGAALRQQSAGLIELSQLEQQVKQQGLGIRFSRNVAGMTK
jgi:phospholipid/cholesterol/gamma-HCH transport system substrate-binding protein